MNWSVPWPKPFAAQPAFYLGMAAVVRGGVLETDDDNNVVYRVMEADLVAQEIERLFIDAYIYIWGLIKRSLQGVMYSVTIRLGLNPSAKDRPWSSRKKLIFSRKIPR